MRQRSYFKIVILLLSYLTLVACQPKTPSAAKLKPGDTVLAFGDSLTYGTGASPETSYPTQLAQATQLNLVNAGVPGEISADGLQRLPALLQQHQPKLVILCHGGNDLLRKLDETELRNNLSSMIKQIRATGAHVMLIGVPKPAIFLSTHPVYPALAEELNIPLLADSIADILSESELKADPAHPNAQGYALLAKEIAAFIAEQDWL